MAAVTDNDEASAVGIRAAWISLAGMGITAGLQIGIVAISGSMALLADTVHNLGHLATTIPLILAFRWGRRPPTPRHSYGFRSAEDLVGLLIGLVIAAVIIVMLVHTVRMVLHRLMDGIDPAVLATIDTIASGVTDVAQVHRVRARWLGHTIEADLAIELSPGATLAQAEHAVATIRQRLRAEVPRLEEAVVQIERPRHP